MKYSGATPHFYCIDDRAFDDCHALTDINVSTDNSSFKSVDGILYDKAATTLIRCPEGRTKTDVIVPDSVTRICYRAFWGCKHIVNVNIPDGVERIESETFYYCENLSDTVLPDSVTAIDDYVFWGTGITSIRFSSALTTIGPDAFGMCNDLETCIYSGTTEQWQSIEFGYNNYYGSYESATRTGWHFMLYWIYRQTPMIAMSVSRKR